MSEAELAPANAVVTCGSCGTRLRVRAEAEGRKGKCPRCGTILRIAMPPAPPVQPAPEPSPANEEPDVPASRLAGGDEGVAVDDQRATHAGTVAALLVAAAGSAAWWAVEKHGGQSLWVVKHALVAWSIGMSVAAAMLIVGGRRTGVARALCAMLAAFAIVSAMFVSMSGLGPMDSLFLALAIAGSACCFLVSQRND